MTRFLFWLVLFGLVLAGCPNLNIDTADDTNESDVDADSDVDSDVDADTDSDVDGYYIVGYTDTAADFFLTDVDDDIPVCEAATVCRIKVSEPGTYRVEVDADNFIFGDKDVVVNHVGETIADWGTGNWGADIEGDLIEANDSDYPGAEHEIEIDRDGELVLIYITGVPGCQPETEMTGLTFDYEVDKDGNWCSGTINPELTEVFIDHGAAGEVSYCHLILAE